MFLECFKYVKGFFCGRNLLSFKVIQIPPRFFFGVFRFFFGVKWGCFDFFLGYFDFFLGYSDFFGGYSV